MKNKMPSLFLSTILINLVSAHTGNDMYDHYITTTDLIMGMIFLVIITTIIALIILWLNKKPIPFLSQP
jgi:hypothetical protein